MTTSSRILVPRLAFRSRRNFACFLLIRFCRKSGVFALGMSDGESFACHRATPFAH
jgi:hypothetical protein